jgi:chromosome segregation protein
VKVLRVREATGDRPAVLLHDQVTVLRGFDPLRRSWLLGVLGRLEVGAEASAEGEIDAHGILFPLDEETLALLDLDGPVPSVVGAEDLPGHDPRIAEAIRARDVALVRRRELTEQITRQREALGAAVAERTAATEELRALERGEGPARDAMAAAEATKARLSTELTSAAAERGRHLRALEQTVLARDVAQEARTAAQARLDAARERRRAAMAAATEAAAALEQATPLLDDDPTDDLVACRAALAAAEAAAAEADPDDGSTVVERRQAALERRRVELVRMQEAIGPASSHPVAEALDRLEAAGSDAPPVVAALALADTWRDVHQQIAALDAGVSDEELAAEHRVAQARQAVIEAEIEFNQPVLTPEQIARVEAAHATVLEAQDRSEGRFGGSRLRKKLEEARSEERRVLERLGFSTYADYMMSSSSRGLGANNHGTLDVARANLTTAEAELAALPGAADRARRRTELLQRRDAVAPRVAALLGHEPTGPEAEDELRELRDPVAPDVAALDALAEELTLVGVAVGDAPYERDDLVLLARFYLSEQGEAEVRRTEIDEAVRALDAAIATLRAARDRSATDLPELAELPPLAQPQDVEPSDDAELAARTLREARWAEVEVARAAVAEAEGRVARHRDAHAGISDLEAALERTAGEEEQAAAEVAAAEADLAAAEGPALASAVASVADAEAALARSTAREDEARRAVDEFSEGDALLALREGAEHRLANAEQLVTSAAAAEQETAAALAEVDAQYVAAAAIEQEAAEAMAAIDRGKLVDDIDWELMGRLAQLRSVGLAGSVPLVLDDPFTLLSDDELGTLLDRLARLAGAVQVVLLSDREAAATWAEQAGPELASVQTG